MQPSHGSNDPSHVGRQPLCGEQDPRSQQYQDDRGVREDRGPEEGRDDEPGEQPVRPACNPNRKRTLIMKVEIKERPLKGGNRGLYLEYYEKGKRTYEFLRLYLIPEVDEQAKREKNIVYVIICH